MVAVFAASPACFSQPPVPLSPGLYEVTTETLLPNLREALRYATTRVRQCLGPRQPASLFPLLAHRSFAGCTLADPPSSVGEATYVLVCANPEVASGTASFYLAPGRFSAVLEVKMGGKNMTFSQRVHGPRLRACAAGPERADSLEGGS